MPSHRQTSSRRPASASAGRHRQFEAAPERASTAPGGRHRGAPAPRGRYAAVVTTAVLGAGIVAVATAASLPTQNQPLPTARSVASAGAGNGVGDAGSARYDPRVGFVAPRAARTRATPLVPILLPDGAGRFTSCFCPRWGAFHSGIDLAAPMLTPIYAAAGGVVKESGAAPGYGNAVVITHDATTDTLYGHMEKILVREGQQVRAGQLIALVGNRGRSTGPHLHFEVHLDGTPVNPLPWLERRGISY